MDIVLQQELPGHQLGDASRLRPHPDQTLVHQQTVHEVAFQGQGTGGVPYGKAIRHIVIDIHPSERPYQQGIVGRQGKTGQEVM